MSLEESVEPVDEKTKQGLTTSTLVSAIPNDDPRKQLEERATAAGIEHEWLSLPEGEVRQRISLQNGHRSRVRMVSELRTRGYLENNFENVIALGEYEAYYFRDKGVIEASILTVAPSIYRPSWDSLPGYERLQSSQGDRDDAENDRRVGRTPRRPWRLVTEPALGTSLSVELGLSSPHFRVFTGRPKYLPHADTMRIVDLDPMTHDAALAMLERVGNSLCFNLDALFDFEVQLERLAPPSEKQARPQLPEENAHPTLQTPFLQYKSEPLSLYWHARRAQGMPLLQFLAYYQVLEYFFPVYSRREALERLRLALRDPRFRPDDDSHLIRLLNAGSSSGEGYGSEENQLKATLRECVPRDTLRRFS